jgi:hypothetical protein
MSEVGGASLCLSGVRPLGLAVGQDTQFSSWGFGQNNIWQNVTLQSFWSSSNIQVAKPSGSTVGAFTGVSPGSFSANANANLIDYPNDCAGNGLPAPFRICRVQRLAPSRAPFPSIYLFIQRAI